MNRILRRIIGLVLGIQSTLLLVTWIIYGFSWWILILHLIVFLGASVLFRNLVQPIDGLDESTRRLLQSKDETVVDDVFERIRSAFQLLERNYDEILAKLAENQERFESVLSGMLEGVVAIDASGNILLVNRVGRELMSIPADQAESVVGKPLIGLVRYEAVQSATRQALETQKTINSAFETNFDQREIKFRVSPMAGDPMPGMTLVFTDVTELTRLENIRRDFVANVSHELKTPLSSIKAYAETLKLGAIEKSPENMQFVQEIEKQSDILNQQIQDLLQLARVESGRETFHVDGINVNDVCQISIKQFAKEAEKFALQIQFEPSMNPPPIAKADSEALTTVVNNLISNAIRYSRQGGVVKIITSTQLESVTVEVIDRGIGIAPEFHQRVFERFFRVDKARSRELGGTGLGLAIVKHLVQSFDGSIEMDSKIGVGSTFRVTLPRKSE